MGSGQEHGPKSWMDIEEPGLHILKSPVHEAWNRRHHHFTMARDGILLEIL
jgi:hypothetical protein